MSEQPQRAARTGVVCPQCRQPAVRVERVPSGLILECPNCGHRWSASEPRNEAALTDTRIAFY
jgi:hypothetical protein